jgi:hypothetical protein
MQAETSYSQSYLISYTQLQQHDKYANFFGTSAISTAYLEAQNDAGCRSVKSAQVLMRIFL